MKAQELKDKYIKEAVKDEVGVIAIGDNFWFHVHDDEEIPRELTIAMHPRINWEVPSTDIPKGNLSQCA